MLKNCLNYPVEIVKDLFGESTMLAEMVKGRKVLLVADFNVVQQTKSLGTRIGAYVQTHEIQLAGSPVVISCGERAKMDNFQSVTRLMNAVLAAGLTAEDFIVVLGGGTLLDVAGWVASQVKGGVNLVRVPTTPAAMLGCAFSETASLNTPEVKDAFQVASRPKAVLIDVAFAQTVLDGVWRAGFSEAVRFAAARDLKLLPKLKAHIEAFQQRDLAALEEIVSLVLASRLKKGVSDYALDYAAELEPQSGWKLPHGYAVAVGILMELEREINEGTKSEKDFAACRDLLATCGALDGARHSRHIPAVAHFLQ